MYIRNWPSYQPQVSELQNVCTYGHAGAADSNKFHQRKITFPEQVGNKNFKF